MFLIKVGEMGYSPPDISEICGLPTYGEWYDEHIPPAYFVDKDSLLAELITVHKSTIRLVQTTHNKKIYYDFDSWAYEFVDLAVLAGQASQHHYFADPSDPFELIEAVEGGEPIYRQYDIPYNDLGRTQYSEELFLVATLVIGSVHLYYRTTRGMK